MQVQLPFSFKQNSEYSSQTEDGILTSIPNDYINKTQAAKAVRVPSIQAKIFSVFLKHYCLCVFPHCMLSGENLLYSSAKVSP